MRTATGTGRRDAGAAATVPPAAPERSAIKGADAPDGTGTATATGTGAGEGPGIVGCAAAGARSAAAADGSVPDESPRAVVVMGVSGCGKSTVARACADRLGWAMVEGDEHHTPESVAKMHAGVPLTDADRADWLRRLAAILERHCVRADAAGGEAAAHGTVAGPAAGAGLFLTCSALRRSYRDLLRASCPGLGFVFLELSEAEALRRTGSRPGHFFPPSLVHSQFATLEAPQGEAGMLAVDATLPVEAIAARVAGWLGAPQSDAADR